ncbi:MAG: NAD-dependent epimerase/dehydratase family protein, partial [Clostridium sp.]|uniref:NAD-dependent epimerase/dehydratase family protein n=1 Tax=Clostridium sp. TaxID=1506 RepID=UPI0025C17B3C
MSDILLLGGTGFVSKACAKYLISRGYDIDILTRGFRKVDYDGFVNHIICDRKNLTEMKKNLQDKNYSYILDFSGYVKEDIEILFESIKNIKTLKRYVFCSSAAVYE